MKKYLIYFVFLFFILLFFFSFFWWRGNTQAVSSDGVSYRFVIPKGYSAMQVAGKLKEKGLIRSTLAFKIYIQVSAKASKIQAGEYSLSPSFSLFKVVEKLVGGPDQIWVTIPEGLRREEIVLRFTEALGLTDGEFGDTFLSLSSGKEGFLFPDTYLVPKDFDATRSVGLLSDTFEKRIDNIEGGNKSGLALQEAITLASLIEREAITDEERPVIAGILLKRLNNDWPLQVDAAVQYAVADRDCNQKNLRCDWWKPLTKEDIEISSPYNTYKVQGLPPAPICNPGLSSIKAVFSPAASEYWFYLHDEKGQIHYAKTIEEHNQNIKKYLGK